MVQDMDLDLHVSRFDWAGEPPGIGPGVADLAKRAEAIGVRTMSFMDHYFQMDWMAPAEDPMLEGYTALGFVAGVTERLRLRLLVTGVTYRHPGLLAKVVTTLDVLSGGRAELGIGAAWYEREHRGLGVPFPPTAERFERLEEALQICLQMWSDDDGRFQGRHYQLEETICRPQPVSQPRPRIMIGGSGERKTLRLVAQYADACNIIGPIDMVAHKIDVLRRHCDEVGRDPNEIEVTAMYRDLPPGATVEEVARGATALAQIGVSTLVTGAVGSDPAGWLESTFGPAMEELRAIESVPLRG
jgi:F420-dependent oxidoreductase-like protein